MRSVKPLLACYHPLPDIWGEGAILASGQRPPMACDRKGPASGVYDIRARYEVIRDHHWTAALCFALMEMPGGGYDYLDP
jgi:hypothetical protein